MKSEQFPRGGIRWCVTERHALLKAIDKADLCRAAGKPTLDPIRVCEKKHLTSAPLEMKKNKEQFSEI